jgi:uncharacterized glyoxalase superfamily protein PhnB
VTGGASAQFEQGGHTPRAEYTDATAPMCSTFEVDADDEVDRLTAAAVGAGGTLLRAPYRTFYGAWQARWLDPERNAVRINTPASSPR